MLGSALLLTLLAQPLPPALERRWELPTAVGASLATLSCARCHAEQSEAMAPSRHAKAASPGLLGQLPTSGPHVGSSLGCLACHAPAADQQPWRTLATKVPRVPKQGFVEAQVAAWTGAGVKPNPAFVATARDHGVGCTACHVRGDSVLIAAPSARPSPHRVEVEPALTDPLFCASCHQFGSAADVNGKPLENTWAEWKASAWGKGGATCQSCHVPQGRHLFQGVHTPDLVRGSVEVGWQSRDGLSGTLTVTNAAVGHHFPTYTTPRVLLSATVEDAQGRALAPAATFEIRREVVWEKEAWVERRDTRIPALATRSLAHALPRPAGAAQVRAKVVVEPDHGYVAIYEGLLDREGLPEERRQQLEQALRDARATPYVLFEEVRPLEPLPPARGDAGKP